jgi:hypothetical protein
VVVLWVPNLKPKPRPRKDSLPRKLLKEWPRNLICLGYFRTLSLLFFYIFVGGFKTSKMCNFPFIPLLACNSQPWFQYLHFLLIYFSSCFRLKYGLCFLSSKVTWLPSNLLISYLLMLY